ncbi:hypothetical protein [Deinococcus kurensis]|uniref:hypothetical protein n=1 Tax=Deinococcus kurensis TaxID=2662757 RepID=UPI0012D301BA|nr:hypothetical protein [Deinococcus kurensis]
MKLSPLAVSIFAASAVFWLVSATAPITPAQHAAGVAKALNLGAPEDLSAPRSPECRAELAAWGKRFGGDQARLADWLNADPIYCVPFKAGSLRKLELALPDVLMRGPNAWNFMRSQSGDSISMLVTLRVMKPTDVIASLGKTRPVLVLTYTDHH